ncbi:MAG: aminopeptidase [Ignavibacteriaceae bacterium]
MIKPLKDIYFDKELSPGAYNAIHTCLRLKPEENVILITDEVTFEIAASLINEIEKTGSDYRVFVLEECANRPLKRMPDIILHNLAKAQVSIFVCSTQPGELASRIQMTKIVNENKIRHGHMVNINKQIMLEGMRADFVEIDRHSQALIERAKKAKIIKAKSKAGTDITAEFSPEIKWIKSSGIISAEKWGNLPGGEIFTSPLNINGKFVVDGVVGDYLCQKYGDLKETPLEIEISDARVKKIDCDNPELLKEFFSYIMTDENSNRVGEFAIGTNTAIKNIIGHILQDEKFPGIHIAFGHPYAEHTGAGWTSTTHIDCVGRDFDVWFDDEKIMEKGKFLQ